jgi:hypothetical protein
MESSHASSRGFEGMLKQLPIWITIKQERHRPFLSEELLCEISRATRKPVILTKDDGSACYDCIVPNLGM